MKKLSTFLLFFAIVTSLMATETEGLALYKKCAGCHGVKAEKKALGKSEIIAGWAVSRTEKALKGYKNGTYGGSMKALMKSQVASYSDDDIKAVSVYIESLKQEQKKELPKKEEGTSKGEK